MESELNEVIRLITVASNMRSLISTEKSKNANASAAGYKTLLQSFLKAKIELEASGFQVPSVQISGLHKAEVISQIIDTEDCFTEHFSTLHQRRDILEAEHTYLELLQEMSPEISNISALDSDILSLRPSQKEHVQNRLNEFREAVNSAEWKSDEHKQRILDKTNELQRELDREISSYTRNLGKLVELGDAIGEFGKRVKPATDRLKDITDSLKIFKKENAQIEKQADPLQIEDKRETEDG